MNREIPIQLSLPHRKLAQSVLAGLSAAVTGECVRPGFLVDAQVMELARRHRVLQLLPPAAVVGEHVRREILVARASCAANFAAQRQALRIVTECLAPLGVPVAVVKGISLTDRLYGIPWSRASVDLDIIVPRDSWEQSISRLLESGTAVCSQPAPVSLQRWVAALRRGSEGLALRVGGCSVDLHFATGTALQRAGRFVERRSALGDGLALTYLTPDDEELFLALTLHAGKHLWGRMQWTLDIAILLETMTSSAFERAVQLARVHGGYRAAAVSVFLARALFGDRVDPDRAAVFGDDSSLNDLTARALNALFDRSDGVRRKVANAVFRARCEDTIAACLGRTVSRAVLPSSRDLAFVSFPYRCRHLYLAARPLRILRDITVRSWSCRRALPVRRRCEPIAGRSAPDPR